MINMTPSETDRMLADARIGRLCLAGAGGRPYCIPLPFCWMNGSLYLRIPLTGRKGSILAANDQVCFEVDHVSEAMDRYASVLIEGRLVPVLNLNERAAVKRLNTQKYERLRGGYRPGHGRSTSLEDLPLRKILVEQLSGRANDVATSTCVGHHAQQSAFEGGPPVGAANRS